MDNNTNHIIKCEIEVEASDFKEAKSQVEQMVSDYYKHYVDTTKIVQVKVNTK